jgi:hypothetical protein
MACRLYIQLANSYLLFDCLAGQDPDTSTVPTLVVTVSTMLRHPFMLILTVANNCSPGSVNTFLDKHVRIGATATWTRGASG